MLLETTHNVIPPCLCGSVSASGMGGTGCNRFEENVETSSMEWLAEKARQALVQDKPNGRATLSRRFSLGKHGEGGRGLGRDARKGVLQINIEQEGWGGASSGAQEPVFFFSTNVMIIFTAFVATTLSPSLAEGQPYVLE